MEHRREIRTLAKTTPQSTPKQPLDEDVDANVDVEEDVNENEEVNVEVYADAPSGSIELESSFSNFSIGFPEEEIENDRERLEEGEESNERNLGFDLKGLKFIPASEVEKEIHINSKSESNNTPPVSPCSEKEAGCSAARPRQQKEPGTDMSDYLEECITKNSLSIARLRKNDLPQDDNLFWRTVGLYCDLYGKSKNDAVRYITKLVNEFIKQGVV